jgi:hypothetical protein
MYKSYLNTFIAAVFFISANLIAEENLFEKNYVLQSPEGFKSFEQNPDTKIMRGWDKDTDNVMMLENGYDFMGFSGFVSTNLPPSIALEHGQNIKADLILIYDRQINEGDRASQFKQARRKAIEEKRVKDFGKVTEIEITEEDLVDPNVMYDFYASYWVKLPKPTFGTHFIELGKVENTQNVEGVQVIAVIKDSAAAKAGILRNDSITSINGQKVTTPDELISLIRKYKGSDIDVGYLRNGKSSITVASI